MAKVATLDDDNLLSFPMNCGSIFVISYFIEIHRLFLFSLYEAYFCFAFSNFEHITGLNCNESYQNHFKIGGKLLEETQKSLT